jgi:hypothetical protein
LKPRHIENVQIRDAILFFIPRSQKSSRIITKRRSIRRSDRRRRTTMATTTTATITTMIIIIIIIIINNASPSIGSEVPSENNSKKIEERLKFNYYKKKGLEKDSKSNKSEKSRGEGTNKSNGKGKSKETRTRSPIISPTYFPTRTPTKNPTGNPSDSPTSAPILLDTIKTPTDLPSLSALPATSPTNNNRGECEDSNTFRFNNKKEKDCNTWVSTNPIKRCKRNDPVTWKLVKYFCPNICKTKCKYKPPTVLPLPTTLQSDDDRGECEDSNTFRFIRKKTFRFNKKQIKNCDTWVSENPEKRCRKYDSTTGKKVRFFCPNICKRKCKYKPPTASALPTTLQSDNRGECEDSNIFRFNNKHSFRFNKKQVKNCDTWVSENPGKRCRKNDSATGKKVRFFCPNICKPECRSELAIVLPSASPSTTPPTSPSQDRGESIGGVLITNE